MKISLKQVTIELAIVLAATVAITAQQPPTKTSQLRVVQYHGDMAALLARLAEDYDVVIGVEADPQKPKSSVTLDLRDVNFHEMLNGIVQSEPLYQWRDMDGSIQIFPVNNGRSLLDTPISSFQVKDVSLEYAIKVLVSLPEVQAITTTMNLSLRPPANLPAPVAKGEISLTLNGVTVRQALNRIVKESGARFWIFQTNPDGTFWIGTFSR